MTDDHKLLLDPALLGPTEGDAGPLLEAVAIQKRYGRNEVLRGVSFGVERNLVKNSIVSAGIFIFLYHQLFNRRNTITRHKRRLATKCTRKFATDQRNSKNKSF